MAFFGRGQDASVQSAASKVDHLRSRIIVLLDDEEANRRNLGDHPWLAPESAQNSLVHSWLSFGVAYALTQMHELAVMSAGGTLTRESAMLILSVIDFYESWAHADPQRLVLPAKLNLPHYQNPANDLLETLRTLVVQLFDQVQYAWTMVNVANVPREMRPWLDVMTSRINAYSKNVESTKLLPATALDYASLSKAAQDYLLLGQQVIKPSLFDRSYTLRARAAQTASSIAPVAPSAANRTLATTRRFLGGTDPLLATAEDVRQGFSAEMAQALDRYWISIYDPDTQKSQKDLAALVEMLSNISRLLASGTITRQTSGGVHTRTRKCPWAPVYVANQTINLGERVGKGTIFAVYPVKGSLCNIQRIGLQQNAAPRIADDDSLWRVTDPAYRQTLKQQPSQYAAAIQQLKTLWQHDDNPAATAALIAALHQAAKDGKIARCTSGQIINICPWSAVYVVTCKRVVIGDGIMQGTRFALCFSADGNRFTREIRRF